MPRFRPFLLLLLLFLTTAACRLTASTGRSLQSADRTVPQPAVTIVPADLPAPGRIAYQANDNNIYTINPGGGDQIALTSDAAITPGEATTYRHITWAPDGRQVAFVRFQVEDGERTGALIAAASDGTERRTLFDSEKIFPFYLFWSPDSSALTFLSNDPESNAIGLYLADRAGGQPAMLDSGSPYYWAWAPDSSRLFVHTGARSDGRLAFLTPSAGTPPEEIDLQPTTFQAPSWSADGERLLLAIENEEGGDALVLINPDGELTGELTQLVDQAAFVLAPDGEWAAVTQGRTLFGAGTVGRLEIISVADPQERIAVPEELVLSFFWSPDGQKLVYFALDNADRQRARLAPTGVNRPVQNESETLLGMYVLDVNTGLSTFIDAVAPTEGFVNLIPYFDQYHGSATIWSPDSEWLVVSALDENQVPTLWIYGTDGTQPPRRLAEGQIGFWSWR